VEIKILQLIEGAKEAKGLTVIIDVFRAFSLACYMTDKGVEKIIPVADINQAYELKEQHPDYVLVGERGGKIQPGFDFGNSPTQLEPIDIQGKTIVHTTSAGTQGIIQAVQADEIITGSFVNAQAIIEYIRHRNPKLVSLVCMGLGGIEEADEDTLCAKYIKNALEGIVNDFEQVVEYLRVESKTGSFLDVTHDVSAPKEDFDKCLSLDRFDFVLKAEKKDGLVYLRKYNLPS
jgi:2-phosphosulfolactate phosphatase